MTPEELREYELSCSEAVDQPPTRAMRLIAVQRMRIEELRESLQNQTALIEVIESERDDWKAKERKCAASYYDLKGEYQELQNQYAAQVEKLKHAETSRGFYISCHTAQAGTIKRLYKELDEARGLAYHYENELAELKVAYASSGELGKDRELETVNAQLEALRTRYKALQMVKDDYLEANTALHQIINNVRRATEI